MARKNLTKGAVDALTYDFSRVNERPDGKKLFPRQVLWDGKVRGFGCRVTPEGGKQYVLSYRFNGRPKLMSLGPVEHFRSLDEAREKAEALLHDLRHKGIDPLSSRERLSGGKTIDELWAIYYGQHLARLSLNTRLNLVGRDPESKPGGWWGNHIAPEIKHLTAPQVTSSTLTRLHDKVTGAAGEITANRCIQRLHHFFEWLSDRDEHLFPPEWKNPADKVKLHKENQREHFLSNDQMRTLFNALDAHEDPYFRGFIGLLLFTAARKSEVLKLRWSDVDFTERTARVKRARVKNDKPLVMPLPDLAIRLLESLPRVANSQWVFPSGRKPSVSMYEPRAEYKRLLGILKLPVETTFHDLRRSVGCSLAAAGKSDAMISAFLNNTSRVAAEHYIHLAGETKRGIADEHAAIFLPRVQS